MIRTSLFTMYLDSKLGTSLESNWLDAIRIAKLLNVDVKFTFNDEVYSCRPETKYTDLPYLFATNMKSIINSLEKK